MQTLDQTIDFQADVLRRDPEKLKAQQGVTPDLLKALATQKALTQQQAAERELSLSMGNNPATVVQQNENNLVEMNKNELAAQTAGIMGQRQQKAVQKGQAMGMPPAQSTDYFSKGRRSATTSNKSERKHFASKCSHSRYRRGHKEGS